MLSSREIYNEDERSFPFPPTSPTSQAAMCLPDHWLWGVVVSRWLWKDLLDQWDLLDALDPWYVTCHSDPHPFTSRVRRCCRQLSIFQSSWLYTIQKSLTYDEDFQLTIGLFFVKSLKCKTSFFLIIKGIEMINSSGDDGDNCCVFLREILEVLVWRERVETPVLR